MTSVDTEQSLSSPSTSPPLHDPDRPNARQAVAVAGFGLCTTVGAVLHLVGADDRFSVENGVLILAMVVVAAWYCPQRPLIVHAVFVQAVWSLADYVHGSVWSICLLGGSTRIVICMLSIIWIARARQSLEQARRFARADSLTGLPNRRAILEALDSELCRTRRSGRSFSLALLDCDGFKAINDRQGHLVGDHVLQCIATGLRKQTRAYDCIGRFGGDEFVMILSEAGIDEVVPIIERIRTALNQELQNKFPSVSFSIGVVTVAMAAVRNQQSLVTWEECVRQADAAMYTAKRLGRDQNHFVNLEIGR